MKLQTLDRVSTFTAELVGTAMLCFFGCMATIQWDNEPASLLQILMGFSMSIMAIIQMFGHISAHLNPAVSVSAFIQGLIDVKSLVIYCIAQFLGAYLGFGLLKLLTPPEIFRRPEWSTDHPGCCTTTVRSDLHVGQGLMIEFIATSVIILTFCAIVDHRNKANTDGIPLRFGFVIFAVALTTVRKIYLIVVRKFDIVSLFFSRHLTLEQGKVYNTLH